MAAFSGKNSDEWAGPKNLLGEARFHVYQNNKPVVSLAAAFSAGGDFTVVWYYEPSNQEINAGATTRQRVAEVFGPSDTYIGILGAMYELRQDALREGTLYMKGGYIPF